MFTNWGSDQLNLNKCDLRIPKSMSESFVLISFFLLGWYRGPALSLHYEGHGGWGPGKCFYWFQQNMASAHWLLAFLLLRSDATFHSVFPLDCWIYVLHFTALLRSFCLPIGLFKDQDCGFLFSLWCGSVSGSDFTHLCGVGDPTFHFEACLEPDPVPYESGANMRPLVLLKKKNNI